jgi:hydroxyacylglutathione hydrolase
MRVERIPTLKDNYTYLVIDEESNQAAVIDAPEVEPVVARIEALGLRLSKVLSTHHHWDHSAANPELARRYGAPVIGHESDAERIPGFTQGVAEGDRVQVGSLEAHVLFIPAHTRAHIAYVFPEAVFCGDCLFAAGCGRLFEGTPAMMHDALNCKLKALPDETLVYCGHEYTLNNLRFALTLEPGNPALRHKLERVQRTRAKPARDWHAAGPEEFTIPSTIGEEKATNPFMRVDSPELIEHVRLRYPETATDPVTILGRVRELKDRF